MKNIKQANLNVSIKQLFIKWIDLTRSFHKLNGQHQKLLASLLYHHYLLKKDITNNKILWKMVFDYDTKLKIKEELGISDPLLQTLLSQLRKKKVIVNNEINPLYIPDITLDAKNFKIVFNFNIIDNEG